MEKEKLKIQVRDVESKQVLFECALNTPEKAWQFAAEMEKLGVDIEIISPTLSQTLSNSLGFTKVQQQEFQDSMEEEINNHDGSCCASAENKESIH